mgnify:CR=1 FL=1
MGVEKVALKGAELVVFFGVVVDQADDPTRALVVARNHIEGFEAEGFCEVLFLKVFRAEV